MVQESGSMSQSLPPPDLLSSLDSTLDPTTTSKSPPSPPLEREDHMEIRSLPEPTKEDPLVSGTFTPDSTWLTSNSTSDGSKDKSPPLPSLPSSLAEEPPPPSPSPHLPRDSLSRESPLPRDVQSVSPLPTEESLDQSTCKHSTPNKPTNKFFAYTFAVFLYFFCKIK